MRWKSKRYYQESRYYQEKYRGKKRVVRRFLFLPCEPWDAYGDKRWLEWATVEEEFIVGAFHSWWQPMRWVDQVPGQ